MASVPARREPGGVPAWQQAMREAVFDAIGPADIAAMMRTVVERAKGGDLKAIEFVFKYAVGGPAAPAAPAEADPLVIDMGPAPGDPSPEEIEARARAIREANLRNPGRRRPA